MISKRILLSSFLVCFILTLVSCKKELVKKELNAQQKVFLDFAKLENRYHGRNYFYNLDIHSYEIESPFYVDETFDFEKLKQELKDSLVISGNDYNYSKMSQPIQFPFQMEVEQIDSTKVHLKYSIFIPDSYEQFSLSKDDIGTEFKKDGVKITLLDLRNDAATLLVENLTRQLDYSYTYGMYNNKKINKQEDIGYRSKLFNKESTNKPNWSYSKTDNNILNVSFDRLNISLEDEQGRNIATEGNITDFRHYLWYRNHDMPFPEMKMPYSDLNTLFKGYEKPTKSHKYNELDIVNIRGLGKISKLNFFLRSNKGKVEKIDFLRDVYYEERKERKETDYSFYNPKYQPLDTISVQSINEQLKVNLVELKRKSYNKYCIYASLPLAPAKQISYNFDYIYKHNDKDSLEVQTSRMDNFIFTPNRERTVAHVVEVSKETNGFDTFKGEIKVSNKKYTEKKLYIDKLPEGYSFDSLTLKIPIKDAAKFALFAFENSDLKKTIPSHFTRSDDDYDIYFFTYEKKPKVFIERNISKEFFSIPFEVKIPKH